MADIINKIKLTIDEALWKNSTSKALDAFAKDAQSTGDKVRLAGLRQENAKLKKEATNDPLVKRQEAAKEKQFKKEADAEFKIRGNMEERLAQAKALKNKGFYREARKELQNFYKEQEREASRGIPLSGGLLFGRRGTGVAQRIARKGGTADDQRSGMLGSALGSVGQHAGATMASTLGGALGGRVYGHLAQGGAVEGGGKSVVDMISWAIGKALSAGAHEASLARQNAGSFVKMGEGGGLTRQSYHDALVAGKVGGMTYEQSSAMAGAAGRAGAGPESLEQIGYMQTRLGMGQESIGLAGAAEKFGKGGGGKGLMDAVAKGTASGLRIGRLPEFFGAVTSILHGVTPGSTIDAFSKGGVVEVLAGLGKAGFKGAQGQAVAQSLDNMAKGGSTTLGQAIALKTLGGFGDPGVGYVTAKQRVQRGLFEDTSTGDMATDRFKKLYEGFKEAIPDRDTMKEALSEASGLKLKTIEDLMKRMEGEPGGLAITEKELKEGKKETVDEAQLKALSALQDPMLKMQQKLDEIFRDLFGDKNFKKALETITQSIPAMAKGIADMAAGFAWLFNWTNKGAAGAADAAAGAVSTVKEGNVTQEILSALLGPKADALLQALFHPPIPTKETAPKDWPLPVPAGEWRMDQDPGSDYKVDVRVTPKAKGAGSKVRRGSTTSPGRSPATSPVIFQKQ